MPDKLEPGILLQELAASVMEDGQLEASRLDQLDVDGSLKEGGLLNTSGLESQDGAAQLGDTTTGKGKIACMEMETGHMSQVSRDFASRV